MKIIFCKILDFDRNRIFCNFYQKMGEEDDYDPENGNGIEENGHNKKHKHKKKKHKKDKDKKKVKK